MKKTILSITMLVAGAALASTVSSDQTFGVLKVTSSAYETAISVPWVAAGTGGNVKVKDLVKTSNLTAGTNEGGVEKADGDLLLLYSPTLNEGAGGYKGWYLNSNSVWTGLAISYNNVSTDAGDSGEDDTLSRGDALILIRKSVSDTSIYLYGQYETAPTEYLITRAAGRKTLFAPVNTSAAGIDLNDRTWENAQDGDTIKLQGAIPLTFTYKSSETKKWGIKFGGQWITDGAVIRPGEGVWYTTTSASGGNVTVTGF